MIIRPRILSLGIIIPRSSSSNSIITTSSRSCIHNNNIIMTSILSPSLRNTLPSLPLSLSHPYTTVTSLFNISDNYGARHKSKRLGRGTGSGKGKRSGRGMKGYLARQGNRSPVPGFIGGGSSLLRAIPKLGTKPTYVHFHFISFH